MVRSITAVIKVSCGESHSLFLSDSGRVLSVGRNDTGQLGVDTSELNVSVVREVRGDLVRKAVKNISAAKHSAVLTEQGELYFFG